MIFLNEAKQILSQFISDTRESLHYVKIEIIRQYHLSIIKEIKEIYPTTCPYIDTVYKIVDGLAQDCPDFVEAPERTNIDSGFKVNGDDNYEESDEYRQKFAETIQKLRQNRQSLLDTDPFYAPKDIEDGLNEPRYPYDTEPSA
jgi:hypothetical protein